MSAVSMVSCLVVCAGGCATVAAPAARGVGAAVDLSGGAEVASPEAPGTAARDSGKRRALIVAIGDYPEGSGWQDLASERDAYALKRALRRKGFARRDVRTLLDAQADAEGIRAALAQLLEESGRGDVVLIHYSGHGHQITDEDSPPEEADGYDEVLVPHGAPSSPPPGYDGSAHIRDDEIGQWLERFRDRVGPGGAVVMTVDACHSGTITRARAAVRGGTSGPIGAPAAGAVGAQEGDSGFDASEATGERAPLVVLSASFSGQNAMEVLAEDGEPMGSLTWAFVKVLERASALETFDEAFAQIDETIRAKVPGQRPQFFGDGDAFVLQQGRGLDAPYEVIDGSDSRVKLDAGALAGLDLGAKVELVRGGEVVGAGEVVSADALSSEVQLDAPVETPMTARARLVRLGFGDLRVRVAVEGEGPERDSVEAVLDAMPVLEKVAGDAEVYVSVEGGAWEARTRAGRALATGATSSGGGALRAALTRHARRLALERVELADEGIALSAVVRRASHRWDGSGCAGTSPGESPSSGALAIGDEYVLEVTKRSEGPLYLTVLVLGASGEVTQLFPPLGATSEGGLLPAGAKTFVVPRCLTASAPAGSDVFKVFATRAPVDFAPALDGSKTRGARRDPLSELIAGALEGSATRGSAPSGAGRTASVTVVTLEP